MSDSGSGADAGDEPRRFAFGRNWVAFLERVDEQTIATARASMVELLGRDDLSGHNFLDAGSGSGLFSLAAHQLGAGVISFDLDLDSVACTRELKRRFGGDDADWSIHEGSVLDGDFLRQLGTFDVVYSWGVLHHAGRLWDALETVAGMVEPGGLLCVAIYNDQGFASRAWRRIKRLYNTLPAVLRPMILWTAALRIWGPTMIRDVLRGQPRRTWIDYPDVNRGMSPWRDLVDWVGGYPFEVATPERVIEFAANLGFDLVTLKDCGRGRGCNEFVFRSR